VKNSVDFAFCPFFPTLVAQQQSQKDEIYDRLLVELAEAKGAAEAARCELDQLRAAKEEAPANSSTPTTISQVIALWNIEPGELLNETLLSHGARGSFGEVRKVCWRLLTVRTRHTLITSRGIPICPAV